MRRLCCAGQSVVLHWQPPPLGQRNGPLTGYKIRYKAQSGGGGGGGQRAQTVVTDASQRSHTLSGLTKDAEYLVKLAALTVNGTGPYTRWHAAQTFHRLQVETTVPDRPASLRGRQYHKHHYLNTQPASLRGR